MTTLVATDLDRTLIYSRAAIESSGGVVAGQVAVERRDGRDVSWVTPQAAATFATLSRRVPVVPVTTRTPEQWSRVRLPGAAARHVVTANGGVLLVDGVVDTAWAALVSTRVADVAPLDDVFRYASDRCDPGWTSSLRTACGLFCYAVLDRAAAPASFVAETTAWAAERGWRVSLQGRKLYWVPEPLTKASAVAEVARRVGAQRVVAAGDSLLDADLLAEADRGIVARHGELVASGWHARHVTVTDGCGPAAGEQIVDWFAAETAGDTVTDADGA